MTNNPPPPLTQPVRVPRTNMHTYWCTQQRAREEGVKSTMTAVGYFWEAADTATGVKSRSTTWLECLLYVCVGNDRWTFGVKCEAIRSHVFPSSKAFLKPDHFNCPTFSRTILLQGKLTGVHWKGLFFLSVPSSGNCSLQSRRSTSSVDAVEIFFLTGIRQKKRKFFLKT